MTWDELAIIITCDMTDEQRSTDVTIHLLKSNEWFKVDGDVEYTQHDDVLDKDHPFLEIPF